MITVVMAVMDVLAVGLIVLYSKNNYAGFRRNRIPKVAAWAGMIIYSIWTSIFLRDLHNLSDVLALISSLLMTGFFIALIYLRAKATRPPSPTR
jgi:hypothetical protein